MDYKGLLVWQLAMDLCCVVYQVSSGFPSKESFGLVSQLRKSAVSVPSNIAEGEGRLTRGERKQFLGQARGSLFELETQLRVAERVGYAVPADLFDLVGRVKQKLDAFLAWVGRT